MRRHARTGQVGQGAHMERWKGAAGLRTVQAPVAAWAGTGGALFSVFSGGVVPEGAGE